jgi:hypothetical protein
MDFFHRHFSNLDDAELGPIRKDLLQLILVTASGLGGVALVTCAMIAVQVNNLVDFILHALMYFLIIFIAIGCATRKANESLGSAMKRADFAMYMDERERDS